MLVKQLSLSSEALRFQSEETDDGNKSLEQLREECKTLLSMLNEKNRKQRYARHEHLRNLTMAAKERGMRKFSIVFQRMRSRQVRAHFNQWMWITTQMSEEWTRGTVRERINLRSGSDDRKRNENV